MYKLINKFQFFIYFMFVFLISFSLLNQGWSNTWKFFRVPTMSPFFADLRTIQASVASREIGLDPQLENPGDPWGRAMNYPKIWVDIAKYLGLAEERNFFIFGLLLVVLFVCSCTLLLLRYPSFALLLSLISGSSLLAIERGNIDILMFFLILISLYVPPKLQPLVILMAVALKIYPVFSIFIIYVNKTYWLIVGLTLATFLFFMYPQLSQIARGNSAGGSLSYGIKPYFNFLSSEINLVTAEAIWLKTIFYLISFLLLTFLFYFLSRGRNEIKHLFECDLETTSGSGREIQMFAAGATVYCGTFISSANWDYRLIFLIFCLPLLTSLASNVFRYFLPVLILISMNNFVLGAIPTNFGHNIGLVLNQLSKIAVFVSLSFILFEYFRLFILKPKRFFA